MARTINQSVLLLGVAPLFAACMGLEGDEAQFDPGAGAVLSEEQSLYVDEPALQGNTVNVCWRDLSDSTATQRAWVRSAVEETWEAVAKVDFTGWKECQFFLGIPLDGSRIVIQVSDVGPAVDALGTRDRDMTLNFTFRNWMDWCDNDTSYTATTGRSYTSRRQYCAESIAVHEFGHALGFAHEQNRSDTPPSCLPCTTNADCGSNEYCDAGVCNQGSSGNAVVGGWDPASVMNYCNPLWNGDGLLSPTDIVGAQEYYGRAGNDFLWLIKGDVRSWDSSSPSGLVVQPEKHSITGSYTRSFTGDFNGDGHSDVFWYEPGSGVDHVWFGGAGGTFTEPTAVSVGGTYTPVVGDFDGNGTDDIVWYGPGDDTDYLWWGKTDKTFDKSGTLTVAGSYVPLAGDFDGLEGDDILWYKPGTGTDYLWLGKTTKTFDKSRTVEVSSTYQPFTGDFDGNGRDDIYWYAPGTGADYIWWGTADARFRSSANQDIDGTYEVIVGDFDGNRSDDIVWNNPASASDKLYLSRRYAEAFDGGRFSAEDGLMPLVGDYDKDGKDDIFWYGN